MLRTYDSGGYCVELCYVVVVMMYYFHSVGGVCWVFKVCGMLFLEFGCWVLIWLVGCLDVRFYLRFMIGFVSRFCRLV